MVNNVSFSITNRCNCHCAICNIWQTTNFADELSVSEIKTLFSHPCFSQVDTINITGGEPLLRNDLPDIIIGLRDTLPKLNRIFINTNGTNTAKIQKICDLSTKLFNQVILSVSLDGTQQTHDKLRGRKVYDNIIHLLNTIIGIPNLNISLSMTLSKANANAYDLKHVYDIAQQKQCMFSFRFADNSSTYYKNTNLDLAVSQEQKQQVSRFIKQYCNTNEFLLCLKQFIDDGKLDILVKDGKNCCLAGKAFVFVHPNGVIAPCLYSPQQITPEQLMSSDISVGEKEPCPCCTDCAIYPMLEELQKKR